LLVPVAVDRRTAFRGRKAEDAPLLVMLAKPASVVLKFIPDFLEFTLGLFWVIWGLCTQDKHILGDVGCVHLG
jgi:hypothetical protein